MLLKSQKSKQRIVGERKQFINFFVKVADLSHSRCLPIEGTFYRRTNSAFSIRYISEQISRLKLRHGRMRQLLGSMIANMNTAPTNT